MLKLTSVYKFIFILSIVITGRISGYSIPLLNTGIVPSPPTSTPSMWYAPERGILDIFYTLSDIGLNDTDINATKDIEIAMHTIRLGYTFSISGPHGLYASAAYSYEDLTAFDWSFTGNIYTLGGAYIFQFPGILRKDLSTIYTGFDISLAGMDGDFPNETPAVAFEVDGYILTPFIGIRSSLTIAEWLTLIPTVQFRVSRKSIDIKQDDGVSYSDSFFSKTVSAGGTVIIGPLGIDLIYDIYSTVPEFEAGGMIRIGYTFAI